MGHFSYTCRLTGLPITGGTRVALIPLIPNRMGFAEDKKYGKSVYVSNDGAQVFFHPLMFPIFGEYNEYGRIENIEKDDHTKILEKHFGLTIQEIADVICSGRKDDGFDDELEVVKTESKKERESAGSDDYGKPSYKKKYEILLKASATWMHRDVYDGLAKAKQSRGHRDNVDLGVPSILKALGFVEQGGVKDPITEAEEFAEKIKGLPEEEQKKKMKEFIKKITARGEKESNRVFVQGPVSLNSDGNWIEVKDNGGGIYDFKELKKYCKKKGLDLDISVIDAKDHTEQIYDYILPDTKTIDDRSRWEGDRIRNLLLAGYYSQPNEINKLYFDSIKKNGSPFMRKNIIDWHRVIPYWYATGQYLTPIGTSPQDGDREAVMTVLTVARDVLKKEIDDRDEGEIDYSQLKLNLK